MQNNKRGKTILCCHLKDHKRKDQDPESGSVIQRYGSADPDLYKNVMDPEQRFALCIYDCYDFIQNFRRNKICKLAIV
jgi:hypothetical protein